MDSNTARTTDTTAELVIDPSPSQDAGRRVKLAVSWETKALTRDLGPYLLSLSYVDNLSGAADDISLELQDRFGLWSDEWRPEFGDQVVARLEAEPWFGTAPVSSLRLGTFSHDEISFSGPPHRATLKCVSAPLATALRRRKRTKVWRKVTLKQIAQDIATRSGLTLEFTENAGPKYKHAVQNNKSDLEFLDEQCKEAGHTLKITESKIVIYEELDLDARDSAGEISISGGHVMSWAFNNADGSRYGSCHVTCFDPRTGKTHKGQFPPVGQTVEGLDDNGQTLELVLHVSDVKHASDKAKALLRNANRFATVGRITTVGDPGLVAGVTFDLTDAFGFDGKYIITRAEHHIVGGYTCSLDIRRCLEGY
jgi:phage protein D